MTSATLAHPNVFKLFLKCGFVSLLSTFALHAALTWLPWSSIGNMFEIIGNGLGIMFFGLVFFYPMVFYIGFVTMVIIVGSCLCVRVKLDRISQAQIRSDMGLVCMFCSLWCVFSLFGIFIFSPNQARLLAPFVFTNTTLQTSDPNLSFKNQVQQANLIFKSATGEIEYIKVLNAQKKTISFSVKFSIGNCLNLRQIKGFTIQSINGKNVEKNTNLKEVCRNLLDNKAIMVSNPGQF